MKLDFFEQVFKKHSNTKFHKNPSGGSRVVLCGRTDRHGHEVYSRFFVILRTRLKRHHTVITKHRQRLKGPNGFHKSIISNRTVFELAGSNRYFEAFKWINQPDAAINYRFIVCRLDTAQHVSGILMPIIRSLSTAASASGLP